ncbi:hypothetical protein A9Q84_16645 [Halobacteriovorax marinus]|uniref:DUF4405 domain-containing protein n=1 Tax=Halobacteriovorax marinus TaxID=97084 RepID=A0A1Y5F8E5_9BACT|nr:hypothetical protein A9Q84_16645 [Halobacteriovorax marinus]
MTKLEKQILLVSIFATTITGILVYLLREWGNVETLLGPEANPFLTHAQGLHYLFTPFFILSISLIFKQHVYEKIQSSEKRRISGFTMVSLYLMIIVSGQILLYITEVNFTYYARYAHLLLGSWFALTFLRHLVLRFS